MLAAKHKEFPRAEKLETYVTTYGGFRVADTLNYRYKGESRKTRGDRGYRKFYVHFPSRTRVLGISQRSREENLDYFCHSLYLEQRARETRLNFAHLVKQLIGLSSVENTLNRRAQPAG